jgi:hypothetical protein
MLPASSRFRLWKWFQHVVEWTSGILGTTGLVGHLGEKLGWHLPLPIPLPGTTETSLALAAALLVIFLAIRLSTVRMALMQFILGPPKHPAEAPLFFRGPRPYAAGERLPGRQADGDACWLLLQQCPFMILEGESGSGKSSLVNAVLMPKAQQVFRAVRVRVGDAPVANTLHGLAAFAPGLARSPADAKSLRRAIATLATANGPDTSPERAKPLLLCLDQFEELFGSVNDAVRTAFLDILRSAVEAGELRVLLVIRSDFSDLLVTLCRDVDARGTALNLGDFYILRPFRKAQAVHVVEEILSPILSANKRLEHEINAFSEVLVDDLLQPPRDARLSREDEKTVLPAELQMVGQMIESLGVEHFTASSFRRHGGRNGLLAAYIEQAKTYVSRKAAVPGEKALLILRQLIPRATSRSAQSSQAVSEVLRVSISQVTAVLEAFAELKLVNRLPASGDGRDTAGPYYELMHEHLGQILREAPDRDLQRANEAEERLRFWHERALSSSRSTSPSESLSVASRLRNAFSQPMPLVEIIRLWRFARAPGDRRMVLGSVRAFVLKWTAVIIPIGIPIGLYLFWSHTDAYQVRKLVADARFVDPTEFSDENVIPISWLLDDWAEILSKSGHVREAGEAVGQAVKGLAVRDMSYGTDTASVILHARAAELHAASRNEQEARTSLDSARSFLDRLDRHAHYSTGSFYAAGRLAEALETTGQTRPATTMWVSAFDRLRHFYPYQETNTLQVIASIRKIAGVGDRDAQKRLWDEAIDAVRIAFGPPHNCVILSALAVELYKQRQAKAADADWYEKKADAVWRSAIQAARQFAPFPPLPPIAQEPTKPLGWPVPIREGLRSADGLRLELESQNSAHFRYVRARVLFHIGAQMYDAGRKDDARQVWRDAVAAATEIEDAKTAPPPPPPVATDDGGTNVQGSLAVPPSAPLFSPLSRLFFLDEAAEILYGLREFDLQRSMEHAISELAGQRINPAPERARTLADSAGRLHAIDLGESQRAWTDALAAASEFKDPGGQEGTPSLYARLPESPEIAKQSKELRQIQAALSGTRDAGARSYISEGVVQMLFRMGAFESGLQAARAMVDEQRRPVLLWNTARELLKRNHADGVKLVCAEFQAGIEATRSDYARWAQLKYLADLQARLRLFRQSRLTCQPCLGQDKLMNSTGILWRYELRRNPRSSQLLRQHMGGVEYADSSN